VHEWYRSRLIEPPTAARIKRLVRSAVRTHEAEIFDGTAAKLLPSTRQAMDAPIDSSVPSDDSDVDVDEGSDWHSTPCSVLKTEPGRVSLRSVLRELEKLNQIETLDIPAFRHGHRFTPSPAHSCRSVQPGPQKLKLAWKKNAVCSSPRATVKDHSSVRSRVAVEIPSPPHTLPGRPVSGCQSRRSGSGDRLAPGTPPYSFLPQIEAQRLGLLRTKLALEIGIATRL
jgi:hypothetical protein